MGLLEAAEVGRKLSKRGFAEREPGLRVALVNAQFDLRESRSCVLVQISGDDRPGANGVLNRLHEWMDARHLATHAFGSPVEAERLRPAFWRYWTALPRRGHVGIHLGGFAQAAVAARLEGRMGGREFRRWIERIRGFEDALLDDGAELVKLWMHLPKAAHAKRLKKVAKGEGDVWRVDEVDWHIADRYDELVPVAEELLRATDRPEAPWHVVEGTDERHRDVSVAAHVLEAMQRAIAAPPRPAPTPPAPRPARASVLDRVDLGAALPYDVYKPRLRKLQRRLFDLARRAREKELRTLLVLEGWDAAGKGGVIRRITRALDARDYRVFAIGAPSEEERAHPHLWRFWQRVPRAGGMVVFDRSWYGRVLVERVEGLAHEHAWRRAYGEIDDFEAQLVEADSLVLKFWLHIDPEEQLRRFEAREKTPYKKYKITREDYRNRGRWDAYVAAVHDMVERTSTDAAPWHLVAANDKRWARVRVLETVTDALKGMLRKRKT